jgi:hypothetical protein
MFFIYVVVTWGSSMFLSLIAVVFGGAEVIISLIRALERALFLYRLLSSMM